MGYEVVLAGWSEEASSSEWIKKEFFGFECYEKKKAKTSYEKFKMFADASAELELLKSNRFDILIAYDFPAVALKKNNEILCKASHSYCLRYIRMVHE